MCLNKHISCFPFITTQFFNKKYKVQNEYGCRVNVLTKNRSCQVYVVYLLYNFRASSFNWSLVSFWNYDLCTFSSSFKLCEVLFSYLTIQISRVYQLLMWLVIVYDIRCMCVCVFSFLLLCSVVVFGLTFALYSTLCVEWLCADLRCVPGLYLWSIHKWKCIMCVYVRLCLNKLYI